MVGINLQTQPSRPPPLNPAVEAWLDSLPPPVAAPSRKELRQWRLTNYHGLGKNVFVTCMVLRSVSLAIALSVTGLTASVAVHRRGPFSGVDRLVPSLVVCPVVALWSIAEFSATYLLRDGGIPPNIHIVVDSVLFLGVATAMGTLLVDVISGLTDYGATFTTAGEEISSICLLVVLMVIHSFLLFFFICNYVDSKRRKSRAAAGRPAMPRYAHNAIPRPGARHAADRAGLLTTHGPPKLGHVTTTVEMEEFHPKPHYEGREFGVPLHSKPTTGLAPAATFENAALAQAMSGLWDVDAESPSQARPPRRYEEAIDFDVDEKPPRTDRYM